MADLSLKYTLIYKGTEYPLPASGRTCEPKSDTKVTRKKSIGGKIHQYFTGSNPVFPFAWEIAPFEFCSSMNDLFNDFNKSTEPLMFRREKPSGEIQTFEVVLDQPIVKLTEIRATGEKWGSLEMEVTSKQWLDLSF